MKAITVKVLPQTEHKPRRLKAFDLDDNNVVLSWTEAEAQAEVLAFRPPDDRDAVHHAAAWALCKKMNWQGPLIGGGIKDGMVFVFTNK